MKVSFLLVAAMLGQAGSAEVVPAAATADQGHAAAPRPEDERREVELFERELFDALARRDRAALERYLADGFTFIHASGALDTREEYLALATAGRLGRQRRESDRSNAPLSVYGGRTAVRQSRAVILDVPLRNTAVYVKTGGRWQWVLSQSTRLPERPRAAAVDPLLFEAFVGEYEIDPGRRLVVTRDGEGLAGAVPFRRKFELIPLSDSVFVRFHEGGGFGDELAFLRDAHGRVTHAALREGAREIWRARKVR